MEHAADTIELVLPFKAEYVSVARLTASGIANRVGFDYDSIEDIKVAVAEVCNKLVYSGSPTAGDYKIVFEVWDKNLRIIFKCSDPKLKCVFNYGESELGISIITALMDDIEFCPSEAYILSMSKALEGNVLNERK
jgi:serine/threonine-protein kinase RsbW